MADGDEKAIDQSQVSYNDEAEMMSSISRQLIEKGIKRFEYKKWIAVVQWSWEVQVGICAICRNHIMQVCIDCQAKDINQQNCTIAWGKCNHSFHLHCITRWIQTRPVCPLDNNQWEFLRYGK